jgi:formylglycine-generating enzyme required for sulfatase activity
MARYYVMIGTEMVGPLGVDEVAARVGSGAVTSATKVCREGGGVWTNASEVPELGLGSAAPATNVGDSSASLTELVGQELVGFRLTKILGEGGMAVVFRGENALDASIARAIKVVRPELTSNPEFVRRFAEEARTLERLQHPNVVRFYGLRRERGLLVMELELLSGVTLSERLKRSVGGLSLDEGIRLMTEAAEGVASAHAMGVVHRDLKPENLFLTPSALKVLDFGIARAIDEADRAGRLTQVGMTLGTPAYMAPEVCNGAAPTAAADVYALGLTLYETLTGSHPILPSSGPRLSSAQIMFAHVNKAVPSLRQVRPDAPPALVELVGRAVAKDPKDRLPDAGTLVRGLRALRSGAPAVAAVGAPGAEAMSTRFDVAHLDASSPASVGATPQGETRFALPSMGDELGLGRGVESRHRQGNDTGFGLPPIDRMRTTGAAAVVGSRSRSGGSRTLVMALFAVAALGTAAFIMKARMDHAGQGEHGATPSAEPVVAAHAAASSAPSTAPDARERSDEANHWIRVEPPQAAVVLGVADQTPPTVRGLRKARHVTAPSAAFDIQQHEVTWGELDPWLEKNPDQKFSAPPEVPEAAAQRRMLAASGVPWNSAHGYCRSIGGSLPREEEWEYAARGASLRPYAWGEEPIDLARTNALGGKSARPKQVMFSDQDRTPGSDASAIYDLMGNVQEWTEGIFIEDKPPRSPGDEEWVQHGGVTWRSVRGLPLDVQPSQLSAFTAAYRAEMCASGPCPKGTDERRRYVGFRCVRRPG